MRELSFNEWRMAGEGGGMIKQAAILRDGEIWTLPRPARHHNIIYSMPDTDKDGGLIKAHGVQGFIDDAGNFFERKPAAIHAKECGQITKPLIAPPSLFSEDLW